MLEREKYREKERGFSKKKTDRYIDREREREKYREKERNLV